MEPADAIALLRSTTDRVSALAASHDLTTPVERLGRWRARDVVAHLGGVHEWAARIVATSSMDGPGFRKSRLHGPDLAVWYAGVAADLLATLEAADAEASCPNFNPGSARTNAFWVRRQLHESLIHAYDLERVLGAPTSIAPDAAADGIDEYLDVFVRTRGKQTLTAPLILRTTDADGVWTLTPARKSGRVDVDRAEGDASAALAGPAMALLLVTWGRLTTSEAGVDVTGDEGVAASFRD